MMEIAAALTGITRLCFDTAPIIYFVEANPRYDGVMATITENSRTRRFIGLKRGIRNGHLTFSNALRPPTTPTHPIWGSRRDSG